MKERCRDGCRTSLLIAGVVLVPAIFHTLLPPCHPYITVHFMEMIFSTCDNTRRECLMRCPQCSSSPCCGVRSATAVTAVPRVPLWWCCAVLKLWKPIGIYRSPEGPYLRVSTFIFQSKYITLCCSSAAS